MKTFAVTLLLIVPACEIGGAEISAPPTSGFSDSVRVTDVIDGDSFRTETGEVRLIGVNAPERGECFGTESREWLTSLLAGQEVGVTPISLDQFDRVLAEVHAGDIAVNLAAAATGHAFALSDFPDFIDGETQARERGIGLWGDQICGADGEPPNLVIDDIFYDPPGNDTEELVVIGNSSGVAVELRGFSLRDESSVNRFAFPSFRLEPKGIVTVTTGCARAANVLNWCSTGPVWNNDGDSVILLDTFGRVAAFRRY